MGFNLCGCPAKLFSRVLNAPSVIVKVSSLQVVPQFILQTNNSCVRPFHLNTVDYPKYRNIHKKKRIYHNKMASLAASYERLDYEDRPTGCILCPHRNPHIEVDFKNVRLLSQFISPHTGQIYGRRITGLCERKQIEMRNAIQRSRKIGLMPVTMKYLDFHGDPRLF